MNPDHDSTIASVVNADQSGSSADSDPLRELFYDAHCTSVILRTGVAILLAIKTCTRVGYAHSYAYVFIM